MMNKSHRALKRRLVRSQSQAQVLRLWLSSSAILLKASVLVSARVVLVVVFLRRKFSALARALKKKDCHRVRNNCECSESGIASWLPAVGYSRQQCSKRIPTHSRK